MALAGSRRVTLGRAVQYGLVTAIAVPMALPLVYLVSTAFKPTEELFVFPPRFLVQHPTLVNFQDLFLATTSSWVPFPRYVLNSVIVSVLSIGFGVFFASMAAYPLAKHKAPGSAALFTMVVAALMFAPTVTSIPRYLLVEKLGLIDSYWALVLPALASPLSLFLIKQFVEQIPDVLFEAGKVDGATEWDMYAKIVMPNCKPAWSTILFLTFVATWNDSWSPMMFTRSEAMKTLPLAIQTLGGGIQVVARQGVLNAAAFLTIVPTIAVFLLTQKRVLQTMVHSGIKA